MRKREIERERERERQRVCIHIDHAPHIIGTTEHIVNLYVR